MIISNDPTAIIDRTDSMYPTQLEKITNGQHRVAPHSTVYGFVLEGTAEVRPGRRVEPHEFFSFAAASGYAREIKVEGTAVIITRHGFRGQTVMGGPIERQGRLCYINHCSDTLLVYPPRCGDPSMSFLHFPPGIVQDFHTHPSFRMGIIFRGEGYAEGTQGRYPLRPGAVFCMEEQEVHRFVTESDQLGVMSFHPDGDWGPTDHDHTLLNRTYLPR